MTKTKAERRVELLRESLGEQGPLPLYSIDAPLVKSLCDIIGSLHRMLEAKGMTAEEIEMRLS